MNKEDFKQQFIEALKHKAQERGARFDSYPADPDKGIPEGIVFHYEDTTIATMIYPDLYYPYLNESVGIDPLVHSAMSAVLKNEPIDFEKYDIAKEKAPDHLVLAVVNYDKNKKLLRDIPHERFLDLALITKWEFEPGYKVEMTDWRLSGIHMTKEEAFNMAKKNTFSKVRELRNLQEEEAVFYEPEDYAKLKKNPYQKKMYVLTTESYQEGAAVIADKKTLDQVHEKLKDDFYILPETDCRVLVVRKSDCPDIDHLMKQVLQEKEFMYDWKETLSRKPYLYDGHKLQFAREQNLNVTDTLTEKYTHHRSR